MCVNVFDSLSVRSNFIVGNCYAQKQPNTHKHGRIYVVPPSSGTPSLQGDSRSNSQTRESHTSEFTQLSPHSPTLLPQQTFRISLSLFLIFRCKIPEPKKLCFIGQSKPLFLSHARHSIKGWGAQIALSIRNVVEPSNKWLTERSGLIFKSTRTFLFKHVRSLYWNLCTHQLIWIHSVMSDLVVL